MSGKIMGKVWDLDLPHNQLLVLLSLADHADHQGNNVFPSLGLTAWKTGYSEQQVRRVLKDLETAKILVAVDRKPGKATIYKIDLSAGTLKPDYVYTPSKMSGVSKSKGLKAADPLHFEHSTPYIPPEENTGINRHIEPIKEKINKKEKMDSQQAPDGAATNGASAPIPASLNKSKSPTAQKLAKAKPKKKTPPPAPPSPRKRKTDLEKWMERALLQKPMVEALLRQFDKAYDPIMFPDLEQFCSMATLEKYVPAAEDLTRLGCLPGDVAEICQYLHPKYNSKGWTIGLKTISEKYQEWKAWKANQTRPNGGAHPNDNGAGRPKSVPVVQKRTPEQYGETLEAIRALRKQAAS